MGQYFTPVLANPMKGERFVDHITGWAYSHDFKNGLKLMEHSYVGNDFVGAITNRLIKHSECLVWAGDYADVESDGMNLYDHADELHNVPKKIHPEDVGPTIEFRYLLSMTKREYVDMSALPVEEHDMTIHPLPLLTAEGNGRGGGDFTGVNTNVGRWARDLIAIKGHSGHPAGPPPGWTQIVPNFRED